MNSIKTTFTLLACCTLGLAATVKADPLPTQYMFGTLIAQQGHAASEYTAGLREAQEDVFWSYMQKTDGGWDNTSWGNKKTELDAEFNAGMKVSLGLGLQYPPAWIFTYANSRYVDQYGVAGPDVVNFTFNQVMRDKAVAYMDQVFSHLASGTPSRSINDFWAIRVGSGPYVEVFYPGETDSASHTNCYWAYDANASGTAANRPTTIPVRPNATWIPGNTSLVAASVKSWYAWYMAAQMDTVNWQVSYLRNKGYTGIIQVCMPGQGTRPADFTTAWNNHLVGGTTGGDNNHTLGRGAVWNQVIDGISNKSNIMINISSVADGSGGDDYTQPGDSSLVIGTNDSSFTPWSASHWISYNANRYSLPKTCETTGNQQTTTNLDTAITQMTGCGMQGMQWAHGSDLYSGMGISLDAYQSAIEEVNGVTNEAENLTVAASSGDPGAIGTDASMSGGKGYNYGSNAIGDYVTFPVTVPHARTYEVYVRVKKYTNRGIFQLAIAPTLTGTYYNHGTTQDNYTSNGLGVYTELDCGPVTFGSSGTNYFRFTITGKNGASSGYALALDDIRLVGE